MTTITDPVARTVQVRSKQGSLQIAADHVYFTFGNGRFAYDCIRCGAKCCRGYGYHVNRATEVFYQLSTRPYTRFFLDALPDDPVVGVKNFPPACFFLNDDGRCAIHAEHGYAAKPETCRLFPFNSFRRVGNYLIVSPHPELCPLEVLPNGVRSEVSEHESLLGAMTAQGIGSEVAQFRTILNDADRAIRLERRIAELSEMYVDPAAGTFQEFIDRQFALTRDESGKEAREPSVSASLITEQAERLLGVDLGETQAIDAKVERTIIALTPYLRSRFVFVRDVAERKDAEATQVILERVPAAVLAVHIVARLATRAGMSNVTFQTVSALLSRHGPLIWCLAHAADVMEWRSGLKPFASRGKQRPFALRYAKVIRDLMPSRQRKHARTLADVLTEHNDFDGAERMAFLAYAGGHLARFVVPRQSGSGGDAVGRPLRARLQLRVLDLLPDTMIEKTCIGVSDLARKVRGKGK